MTGLVSVERIQAYLRRSAYDRYDAVCAPPFTLFFHPTDAFPHFNYAIPDEPVTGNLQPALARLKAEFATHGRQPRFEFIEAFAPQLAGELQQAGFVEEGRQHLMVCTPESYTPAPALADLRVIPLNADSPLADGQGFLMTQRLGFDPEHAQPPTEDEARAFLQEARGLVSFLGRWQGEAASAATYTQPHDGVTEIVGVATIPALRRRGIATALTSVAVAAAFAQGADVACLTAGDASAGRVYERIGFRPYATMLAYNTPTA